MSTLEGVAKIKASIFRAFLSHFSTLPGMDLRYWDAVPRSILGNMNKERHHNSAKKVQKARFLFLQLPL